MRVSSRVLIVLFVALFVTFSLNGSAIAHLSDIQGHWAERSIRDWVDRSFATGYPDGTFNPDNSITRAEFITLVNKSFGFHEKTQVAFSDVSKTDWFYEEIVKATAAGYITGYGDNTIRPDNAINRQEMAAVIFRLLDITTTDENEALSKFKDAGNISSWAKASVSAVSGINLLKGYPDHTFRPLAFTTRAEALVSLSRAFWFKNPVIITKQ